MDPERCDVQPPSIFRLFTKESITKIENRIKEEKEHKLQQKEEGREQDEEKEEDKPIPNPALEVGKSLPPKCGDFQPELYGKPVEDIDEFYHNKHVFMVVAKDKTIFRFSASNALFLLSPFNPLRRGAIYVLTHPFFSLFVMVVILANCAFMAIKQEVPHSEIIFTVIYTIEGLTKILARGFVLREYTYLRDLWNWLDFVVVSLAYITMAFPLGNLAALRTFRVLRALKTVAVVPGLKTIVGALLEAVRRLRDVMILSVFILSIFALVGLQIYQGVLKFKCIKDPFPDFDNQTSEEEKLAYYENETNWFYTPGAKSPRVCGLGSDAGKCPSNHTCLQYGNNPDYGYTNFDNFGWAMLCAFRLMTQDYWENLYQLVIRAQGPWHMLFFVLVIFMGSFYLVNLILAIVAMSYDEQQKQDLEDEEAEEEEAAVEEANRLAAIEAAHKTPPFSDYDSEVKPLDEIISLKSDEVPLDTRRLSIINSKGKKASLSLPPSPLFNHRRPSRVSQFSWKPRKGHSPRAGDRQPLVFPCLDNLNLPYMDESNAVTPTSEELCNWQNTHGFPSSHGRRQSSTSYTSRMSQLESRFDRRGSVQSRGSTMSRDVIPLGVHPALKTKTSRQGEPTHFHFGTSFMHRQHPLLPEVKVDKSKDNVSDNESSSSGSDCETAKGKLFPDNPFICSRTPSATNVDMKDVMLLKDLINHASGKRRGTVSNDGMTAKEYWKAKCIQLLFGWECSPGWHKFAHYVELIIMDAFADLFITLCIVVNTVFMAIDQADMSNELAKVLQIGNYVFTFIFTLEAVLKIIALNPINYVKDKWNSFDVAIVFLSLVELSLSQVKGLSILRSFRLLRVFKLAKSWPTLNLLIGIIGRTLGALGNLCFVLAIIVFIFAVMGMQLFGKEYTAEKFGGEVPRWNFTDFFHSFMIVFRVLCGEWIESMWDCIHCNNFVCIPFFLLTMIIGNLVVLNLFLALLLSSFGAENLQRNEEETEPNKLQEAADRINRFIMFVKSHVLYCIKVRIKKNGGGMDDPYDPTIIKADLSSKDMLDGPMRNGKIVEPDTSPDPDDDTPQDKRDLRTLTLRLVKGTSKAHVGYSPVSPYDPNDPDLEVGNAPTRPASTGSGSAMKAMTRSISRESKMTRSPSSDSRDSHCSSSGLSAISSQYAYSREDTESLSKPIDATEGPEINEVNVVFVRYPDECCPQCCTRKSACCDAFDKTAFGQKWWTLRCYAYRLVEHKYFETFIIFMIVASSLALAIEDRHISERGPLELILKYLDKVFTLIFVFEMLVKWGAYGFKKYFTDAWCWLDFVIVAISLISLAAEGAGLENIGAFRALRTLRALRPLRAVSRWEGMRVVVNALIQAIPSIFNVLMVCLVFWLIFSIMGVQLFGGRYWRCQDADGITVNVSIVHNMTECKAMEESHNFTWINAKVNFDHVFCAYLSLLQVATFKGWIQIMDNAVDSSYQATFKGWIAIMNDAVDSKQPGEQPEREIRIFMYLYFVFFIVFGSFFTLNLFIGVIIDNFNMQKKKAGGSLEMFMSEDQKKYYNAMKKLGSKAPTKPIPKPRWKCQLFFFKLTTNQMFDIGIMTVILLNMMTMAMEHYGQSDQLTTILLYINQVFIAIFTLECVMKLLGLRHYYFKQPWNVFDFIVVVLSILGLAMADLIEDYFVSPTLLRVVRVFRVGRVLRLVKSAKGIRTLLFSLAVSLPALINIGLLLFLVMFIFSIFGMSFFMHVKHYAGIDDMFNMETFCSSMIILFQISTSAGWDGTLAGLMNTEDCHAGKGPNGEPSNCGNPAMAVAFMVAYLLIAFLVVINMYIAVILENFSQATEDVQQGLTQDDFDMYYETWEKYDEEATQFIPLDKLSEFVDILEEPLCLSQPNYFRLVSMDIPICEGDLVHCVDILDALTKNFLGTTGDTADFGDIKKTPETAGYIIISSTLRRQREIVCVKHVQRAWRNYRKKKGLSYNEPPQHTVLTIEEAVEAVVERQHHEKEEKEKDETDNGQIEKDEGDECKYGADGEEKKDKEKEGDKNHSEDTEDNVFVEDDSKTVELFPESGVVA